MCIITCIIRFVIIMIIIIIMEEGPPAAGRVWGLQSLGIISMIKHSKA